MPIKKITISELVSLSELHPVIDVRSPGEFAHAHFPKAHNIPLFTNEERKEVGIAYKQVGKQKAIKVGLDYFGPRMKTNIEEVEKIFKQLRSNSKTIIVHCWRGGMRSAGMAWLFDLYGFEVYIVVGGYKAFRTWALEKFEASYEIQVLGGYTGSSKTELLHEIKNNREAVIDLEGIALHKGSAFGGIGLPEQPTQEMFENMLAIELSKMNQNGKPISFWIEDESQRIGRLNIPNAFWKTIRAAPLFFIDIEFETRLDFILNYYGKLDKQALINAILRIQKRLGPNETKLTINYILENNIKEAFRILLQYYDKTYIQSLHKRDNIADQMKTISMATTQAQLNYKLLQQFINNQ